MTREQEFKVLEQIKAILDSLPEDSYVKAGFKGCCGIAEANIVCDLLITPEENFMMLQTINKALKTTPNYMEPGLSEMISEIFIIDEEDEP